MSVYTIEEQGNYKLSALADRQETISLGTVETSAEMMKDLSEHVAASYSLLDRDDL